MVSEKENLSGLSPLQRMRLATDLFREHDPNVTAVLIEAFLAIASAPDHNPPRPKDVADALGVGEAAISQIIMRLGTGKSAVPRNGKPLGLVEKKGDPLDGRASRLKLTASGRNLATSMTNVLGGKLRSTGD